MARHGGVIAVSAFLHAAARCDQGNGYVVVNEILQVHGLFQIWGRQDIKFSLGAA